MLCRTSGLAVLAFAVVAIVPARLSAADALEGARRPARQQPLRLRHEEWIHYRDEHEQAGRFTVAAYAVERSLELGDLARRARSLGTAVPPGFAWGAGGSIGGGDATYLGVMTQLCATSNDRRDNRVFVGTLSGGFELRQRLLTLGRWMPYVAGSLGLDFLSLATSGAATALFDAGAIGDDKRFHASRTWAFAGLGLGGHTRLTVDRGYNGDSGWGLGFEIGRWFGAAADKQWLHDKKELEGPSLKPDGWYLRIALSYEVRNVSHRWVPERAARCVGMLCDLECNAGWDNCDGLVDNGCETPLNTTAHCGTCDEHCTDGQWCRDGRCVP